MYPQTEPGAAAKPTVRIRSSARHASMDAYADAGFLGELSKREDWTDRNAALMALTFRG